MLPLFLISCLETGGTTSNGSPTGPGGNPEGGGGPVIVADAGTTSGPAEGPAAPQDNPPIAAPILPPPGPEGRPFDLGLDPEALCARPGVTERARVWTGQVLSDRGTVDLFIFKTPDDPPDAYLGDGLTVIPADTDSGRSGVQMPTTSDGTVAFEVLVAGQTAPALYHLQVEGLIEGKKVRAWGDLTVGDCQVRPVSPLRVHQLTPVPPLRP